MVGRVEVKADRTADTLSLEQVWPEPDVVWTGARDARLEAELARLARLIAVDTVHRKTQLKLDLPRR